jgi:hypothetical protein
MTLTNSENEFRRVAISYVPEITNKMKNKFNDICLSLLKTNINYPIYLVVQKMKQMISINRVLILYHAAIVIGNIMVKPNVVSVAVPKKIRQTFVKISIINRHWRSMAWLMGILMLLLDVYESFFIKNEQNSLNKDNRNINSHLLLLKYRLDYSAKQLKTYKSNSNAFSYTRSGHHI